MPLNPRLYASLQRVTKVVTISNAGQPMAAVYYPGPDGKPRLTVSSPGEYYVADCPFCHDTRGHLYVNHRWGVRDPVGGTRNLWLANCFLSDCMRSWENRRKLLEMVEDYALAAAAGVVRVPDVAGKAPGLVRYELPHDFRLLTDLPRGHPARRYVRRRGFGPDELARGWGVGFSSALYREVPGRLVIPLRANLGENTPAALGRPGAWDVVGYQGRLLGDPRGKTPKYLTTQTPKSRLLYGLDRVPPGAAPVVLVEGPVDAWRAGPGAVAVLGKAVSDEQCRLLRAVTPGRDVVVMFDPEAEAEAHRAADRLRSVLARDLTAVTGPGRVAVARLPDARDPGDCTAEEIAAAVRRALSRRRKPDARPN